MLPSPGEVTGEIKQSDAKKSNDSPLKRLDNHEYATSLKEPLLCDRTPGETTFSFNVV